MSVRTVDLLAEVDLRALLATEYWWCNTTRRKNGSNRRKTCHNAILSTTYLTWTGLGTYLGVCRAGLTPEPWYNPAEMCWHTVTHGRGRGNWRMEWVASTLHTTSEHGVSSITTADAAHLGCQ